MRWVSIGLLTLLLLGQWPAVSTLAEEFANPLFRSVWATTDAAVASGAVSRAWIWGPEPISAGRQERYAESPGGQRLVQYFDKGRLELNQPGGPATSGLLARELVTGQLQTGDGRFEPRPAAPLAVVGDPDDVLGPTYASLARVLARPPLALNAPLVETVDRDGSLGADLLLSRYNARADVLIPETQHRLASVFRAYFEGQRLPNTEGESVQVAPFAPWYTVTGLPITEGYWTRARVNGIERDVLVQVFERRVLTYTPANPADSRVEMGNVGRHYLAWLADATPPPPAGLPCPRIVEPPLAGPRENPYVILGSTLHELGGRRLITGSVRNDGSTSVAVEVRATLRNADGSSAGRFLAFTDRDFWAQGQVAAFRIDLPQELSPADWSIEVRRPDDRPTGGLASGFTIENLRGTVDGNGIGRATGQLRYTGAEPFTELALVRIYALDSCGSLVSTTFTRVGGERWAPNSVNDFGALLLSAEGASRLEAVVEARTGTISDVPPDTLRLYQGTIFPAPIVPITESDGCCRYTRLYQRPDGTTVRQLYRRASGQ